MQIGALTGYFDVAQVTLYGFWIFFAGLMLYLRREDKREGYPMIPDRPQPRTVVEGFPPTPPAKRFILGHGGFRVSRELERPIAALPTSPAPGSPLEPTGNPMIDGVGPASWAMRTDEPDVGFDDRKPKIVPLRLSPSFFLATEDPNPIGMPVVGADRIVAGTCVDVWIDRSEVIIRFLEAEVAGLAGPRRVLIPMNLAKIVEGNRPKIRVASLLAAQFAEIPAIRSAEQITLLEEDKIFGYFGGGKLYATPARLGPLL